LGYQAGANETQGGRLYIANSNTSSPLVWGNFGGQILNVNGRLGIGDTTPTYRLDVAQGDVNTQNGGYRDAGICVAGTCFSDRRLKEEVTPLSGSLELIARLNPVSYRYIDPAHGSGTQYGLVAQEVEEVFPEWVVMDGDGYRKIRYGLQVQMHLIQAVKELQAENEELKKRLAEHEALEQRVAEIEAMLLNRLASY
jgi:hypothetical protein